MNRKTAAATLGVTGALCSAALAHCPPYWYEIVAIEGDVVAGVGAITGFGKVAVSGGGDWRVEAHTDHPDPAASTVMLGRKPFLRQGQSLVEPPGATLAGFEDFDIVFSSRAWIFRLETGSAADNAGLYLNDALLIQKGDVSSAPEFAPGTTYGELLHIRFDRFRSIEMLLMAEVEDPATGSAQAIVWVQYDPATGEVIERALRKSGDILPGQTEPIDTFPAGRSGYAGFFRDQFALVADLEGAPERDSVLYLGDMLLAQEGDESVLPGRRWQALEAVTATEFVAARARVDGDPASDTLIVAWPIGTPGQPEILAQKGGAVPGVPGAVFTDFGAAPLAPGL